VHIQSSQGAVDPAVVSRWGIIGGPEQGGDVIPEMAQPVDQVIMGAVGRARMSSGSRTKLRDMGASDLSFAKLRYPQLNGG